MTVTAKTAFALKAAGFPRPEVKEGQWWYDVNFYDTLISHRLERGDTFETFTPGSCSTYDESSFEGWTFAPTIDDITPLLPAGFALEIWDGKPSCTNRDDENPLRTTGDTFAEAAAMMWLEVASLRGYGAN